MGVVQTCTAHHSHFQRRALHTAFDAHAAITILSVSAQQSLAKPSSVDFISMAHPNALARVLADVRGIKADHPWNFRNVEIMLSGDTAQIRYPHSTAYSLLTFTYWISLFDLHFPSCSRVIRTSKRAKSALPVSTSRSRATQYILPQVDSLLFLSSRHIW
jgi:hypothetical protein